MFEASAASTTSPWNGTLVIGGGCVARAEILVASETSNVPAYCAARTAMAIMAAGSARYSTSTTSPR